MKESRALYPPDSLCDGCARVQGRTKHARVPATHDTGARHVASDSVLTIEQDGQTIGFCFVPGADPQHSLVWVQEQLEQTAMRMLSAAVYSEEQCCPLHDLTTLEPSAPTARCRKAASAARIAAR